MQKRSKPPAPFAREHPATDMRGDEREDSTSTERQPLGYRVRRSDLAFAAKQLVRRELPRFHAHAPSASPRAHAGHSSPQVQWEPCCIVPVLPHSAGLRPALPTTVHTRPEGVK